MCASSNGTSRGKWRIYTSAETHTLISKAVDLFGLVLTRSSGYRSLRIRNELFFIDRKITDDKNEGFIPLMIVGTAGWVGTGAVDPLPGNCSNL